MKKILLPVSILATAFALAGCLGGKADYPFPTRTQVSYGGGAGGAGGMILDAPTAPQGRFPTDAGKIANLTSDLNKVTQLADPTQNGGASSIAGIAVPGFGALSVDSDSSLNPWRHIRPYEDSPLEGCIKVTGSATDNDADGFVKGLTTTFDCKLDFEGGNGTFTFTGSMRYEDENDNKPYPEAGYQFIYDNMEFNSKANGHYQLFRYNGAFKVWREGKTSRMSAAYETFFDTDYAHEQDGVGSFGYFMDWKLVPSDVTAPFASGKVEFTGFYRNTQNLDITLQYYTTNLTYSTGCTGFYENGSITYVDGSGGKLVFKYTSCDVDVTLNGQPIN